LIYNIKFVNPIPTNLTILVIIMPNQTLPINPMRTIMANPVLGFILAPFLPLVMTIQMIMSIQQLQQQMLQTMLEMEKLEEVRVPETPQPIQRKPKIIDIKRDEKGNIISIIEY